METFDEAPPNESTKETTKYFELGHYEYPIERFKYSLFDIQMENVSRQYKDETIRTAIMNPEQLPSLLNEERQILLNDLALLENTIIETRADINAQFEDMNKSLKDMDKRLKSQ